MFLKFLSKPTEKKKESSCPNGKRNQQRSWRRSHRKTSIFISADSLNLIKFPQKHQLSLLDHFLLFGQTGRAELITPNFNQLGKCGSQFRDKLPTLGCFVVVPFLFSPSNQANATVLHP